MIRKLRLLIRENRVLRKTIYPPVFWIVTRVLNYKQRLLQKYGFLALERIHKVATSKGVSYFADCGTLLGLIRDKGFIKHDTDMDFSIIMPQSGTIKAFYSELEDNGFYFERFITVDNALREFTVRFSEISVDFFVRRYCSNHRWFDVIGENCGAYYQRFRKLAPTKVMTYLVKSDVEVNIPENYDAMLTSMYGNWHQKVQDWDDSMSPMFEKDYTPHITFLSRNREDWLRFVDNNRL